MDCWKVATRPACLCVSAGGINRCVGRLQSFGLQVGGGGAASDEVPNEQLTWGLRHRSCSSQYVLSRVEYAAARASPCPYIDLQYRLSKSAKEGTSSRRGRSKIGTHAIGLSTFHASQMSKDSGRLSFPQCILDLRLKEKQLKERA